MKVILTLDAELTMRSIVLKDKATRIKRKLKYWTHRQAEQHDNRQYHGCLTRLSPR